MCVLIHSDTSILYMKTIYYPFDVTYTIASPLIINMWPNQFQVFHNTISDTGVVRDQHDLHFHTIIILILIHLRFVQYPLDVIYYFQLLYLK